MSNDPHPSSRPVATKVALVAHRGASHAAPENTLPAMRLAFEEGADSVEGDYWLTRDDRVVCLHDDDTRRTAPGQPGRRVQESTLVELRELDVGAWKAPRFAGARIPTLDEMLAALPEWRGIVLEIKDDRPAIVGHMKRVIDASGCEPGQIVISAFDPAIIRSVKEQMPDLKVLWLYWWYWDKKADRLSNTADEILHVARALGADGLNLNNSPWADGDFVSELRAAGLEFHVYTIDDLVDAVRYATLGVGSITTNRPRALRRQLDDYFAPLVSTSDAHERLTVKADGTWSFTPHRPRREGAGAG